MTLPHFCHRGCFDGLLWENHTLYARKILIWQNSNHSRPEFGHFLPKLTVWEFLASSFQTPLRILLIFCMEVVLMVFFEKIMLYMPGEFWYGKILAFFKTKIWHFLRVFGQTLLWIWESHSAYTEKFLRVFWATNHVLGVVCFFRTGLLDCLKKYAAINLSPFWSPAARLGLMV